MCYFVVSIQNTLVAECRYVLVDVVRYTFLLTTTLQPVCIWFSLCFCSQGWPRNWRDDTGGKQRSTVGVQL